MIHNCEDKDLYILSSSIDDVDILYSPKRGIGCFIKSSNTCEILKYLNDSVCTLTEEVKTLVRSILNAPKQNIPDEADVEILDKTAILLNQSCNLRCSYCYASKARATEHLSKEKFLQLVKYIFNNKTGKKKSIFLFRWW